MMYLRLPSLSASQSLSKEARGLRPVGGPYYAAGPGESAVANMF